MSVTTVDDLLRFTRQELVDRFGKWGTRLWELARGIDESPVVPSRERKSWSSENTFAHDITMPEVAGYIREEAHRLWDAISRKELVGRTVTVKLRTADFKTATRRLTPDAPPSSGDELAAIGVTLLGRFDFPGESRYRLAGIGLSNFLNGEEEEQPTLFRNDER
jgi:DNA polymerase-4